MNAAPTSQLLPRRVRKQTERFLTRAVRSMRDPRAEYERLVRRLHRQAARGASVADCPQVADSCHTAVTGMV